MSASRKTSPAYFDLQVNGYAGVDFNRDDVTPEQLHEACLRLEADGVAGVLVTFITDTVDSMCARLHRIGELRAADPLASRLIDGFHIEGPFINEAKGYVGAHPPTAVRPAEVESTKRLLDAAGGLTRILTLAPERDSGMRVTRFLTDRGIVVSAGHCDPTLDELRAGIDAGLSMFTHVGNGCPAQLDRHDNIIQRALSLADQLWLCFIADGAHVPCATLGNYLRCAGLERSIVVTDAISAAGLGPGRYPLGSQMVEVDENLVTRIPGDDTHLAGSAATMPWSVGNLERLGYSADEIVQLTATNPRAAIVS
jgi:N-acetylglucosamine-6-phosphate deacetylase